MGTSGDIRRIGATRAAFNLQLDSAGARVAHGCAPRRRSARRAALSCRARPRRRPRALARQWAGLEREARCCATRSLTTSLGPSPSDSQRPGTPAADGAHVNRAQPCATTPSRRRRSTRDGFGSTSSGVANIVPRSRAHTPKPRENAPRSRSASARPRSARWRPDRPAGPSPKGSSGAARRPRRCRVGRRRARR
jgi:hypothetical protein